MYNLSSNAKLHEIAKWTYLFVRFWNVVSDHIRYLNSTFLGHSAASDILQYFNEVTKVLNLSKMLQVCGWT